MLFINIFSKVPFGEPATLQNFFSKNCFNHSYWNTTFFQNSVVKIPAGHMIVFYKIIDALLWSPVTKVVVQGENDTGITVRPPE